MMDLLLEFPSTFAFKNALNLKKESKMIPVILVA